MKRDNMVAEITLREDHYIRAKDLNVKIVRSKEVKILPRFEVAIFSHFK